MGTSQNILESVPEQEIIIQDLTGTVIIDMLADNPVPTLLGVDAHYLCENVEVGLDEANLHHPFESGYFTDDHLFHARFRIPTYGTQYAGFWCEQCIEKLGVAKGMSLKEFLSGKTSE